MTNARQANAASLLSIGLALCCSACVFDKSGVGAFYDDRDGAVDLSVDLELDAEPDLEPDAGADQGTDGPGPLCAPDAAAELVCRFDDDDVGQSGLCQGETFAVARHCFPDAPCVGGVCTVSTCEPCEADTDCNDVCTLLFVPNYGIELCCAAEGDNDTGDADDACSDGTDCYSGLCTEAGFCFEPCVRDEECSTDSCGLVKITLAGVVRKRLGCQPKAIIDGGPDSSLDGGSLDGGSLDGGLDAAPPDGMTSDGAPPDGMTSDGGADSTPPDAALDGATDTILDAGGDAVVDGEAGAAIDGSTDGGQDAAPDADATPADAITDSVTDGADASADADAG